MKSGACLIAGFGACLFAWTVPDMVPGLGNFSGHMLRHMVLVAVAAPLLVLSFQNRIAALDLSPLAGAVFEFLVVWSWHLPVLHAIAWKTGGWFVVEQASFLLAGTVMWASALKPGARLAGAGGLLLTSMHMTLLGTLLTLAPRDLYAAYCGYAASLDDQRTGGLLMLAIGTPVYLCAGLWLVALQLRQADGRSRMV